MQDETLQTYTRAKLNKKQRAFLDIYQQLGHVSNSAIAVGIARQTHYDWLETNQTYAEAYARAEKIAGDMLIDEARRRAHDGWEEPVFQNGVMVGKITKYDSALLTLLIKKHDPRYREKYEVTGKDGKDLIPLGVVDAILDGE